ncbi:putative minor capsid protein [Eel River basin pequenovirus]|nr:putative minor capsid protein [Eel River basin pequenovirus]
MAMMEETIAAKDYGDGRTKQSFKDSADINKILARAQRGEAITHLAKYGGTYEDFSDYDDLLGAHQKLARGQQIFDELPGEVKREFHNSASRFYSYVNDPANAGKLHELIPGLTAPGTQLPSPNKRTPESIEHDPAAGPEKPAQPAQTNGEGTPNGTAE